jgi:hypothetical protein
MHLQSAIVIAKDVLKMCAEKVFEMFWMLGQTHGYVENLIFNLLVSFLSRLKI